MFALWIAAAALAALLPIQLPSGRPCTHMAHLHSLRETPCLLCRLRQEHLLHCWLPEGRHCKYMADLHCLQETPCLVVSCNHIKHEKVHMTLFLQCSLQPYLLFCSLTQLVLENYLDWHNFLCTQLWMLAGSSFSGLASKATRQDQSAVR